MGTRHGAFGSNIMFRILSDEVLSIVVMELHQLQYAFDHENKSGGEDY